MLKSKNKLLHKALAFVLTFSLLASLVSFNFTANAEITGEGTANNPYTIATLDDLKTFASKVNEGESKYTNAYAKLADNSNITITDPWTPIGNETHKFTGVFDGNGKTITFSTVTDGDYVGLFGINEGTIKNVKIVGTISTNTELAFVGGVAGLNRGTIINCESSVAITANGVNSYAGGIAGVMQNGTIDSCKNSGDVTVTVSNNNSNDVTDHEASAGGIVAFNYNGTVKKCENTATITNDETYGYTGGIVGNNDGTINNCLNGGSVTNNTAADYAGGIAGNLFTNKDTGSTAIISNCLNTNASGEVVGTNNTEPNAGTVTNSYYLSDTLGDDNGATAVTETELKSGDVTYKLNGNTAANPVWGQTVGGSDSLPTIGATEKDNNIVYPDGDNYTNTKPEGCDHANGTLEDGSCNICGYTAAKLNGYSVTLDGRIGLNYKYTVDSEYANATFTPSFKNGEKELPFVEVTTKNNTDKEYRVFLASDEMNIEISSSLTIENEGKKITLENKPYSVNKYLNTLYTTDTASKELVQAMSTYGYYAREYFDNYPAYEPTITLYDLSSIDSSDITDTKYNMSYGNDDASYTLTHYASSMQHLDSIAGIFYVKGNITDNTVMRYRTLNINNDASTSDYTIKNITQGATNYNWSITDKIPVSKLRDTKFEVSFGTGITTDDYNKQSRDKFYTPYGYIKNTLKKYENSNDTKNISYKLAQALYHYSEAAADYFPSQNS